MFAIGFDFDHRKERPLALDEVSAACAEGMHVWVDFGPGDEESGRALLAALNIPEEAIVQVFGPDREGRYDLYENCLHFAVTEALPVVEGRMRLNHVDVLLATRCTITYHRGDPELIHSMRRTCPEDFARFAKSSGFLLYEIGDHLIDGYRKMLRAISSDIDEVQVRLFGDADDVMFRRVAELTGDLLALRKVALASRELIHELCSRMSPFVPETTVPYLHGMASTMERIGNDLTNERDELSNALGLYMGMVTHRTNKVISRLTIISIVFLPLTFLCGVYGMNFKFMPELEWRYGYLLFWVVVPLIVISLVVVMRRRRWF